jgi:hypothetical protein
VSHDFHPRSARVSRKRRLPAITVAFTALTLLAGCAGVAEKRVESGLTDAGVPAGAASCMADKWVDKLSNDQIRDISRFAKRLKADRQRMTLGLLVDHVSEWNDPEAMLVISVSAAQCAFR